MAYSYIEYTVNTGGAGTAYTYAFGAVAHNTANIKVSVGGTILGTGRYTVTSGTVTLEDAPGSGSSPLDNVLSTSNILRVYRESNRTSAETVFSSASVLQDSDLNDATNQGRYLALEAIDRAEESIEIDPADLSRYNAQVGGANKRIGGIADPADAQDAATKTYVDSVASGTGGGLVTETGSQTLTNKTLTAPVINGALSGSSIDTDLGSTSSSDDSLASAKAVKAYVDAQVTAQDLDVTSDSGGIDIDLDSEALAILGGTGINTSGTGASISIAIDSTVSTKANATNEAIIYAIALG